METKQTAVEWLIEELCSCVTATDKRIVFEKAKQMEKEQTLDLMSNACMFFAASFHDHDLKTMTYEEVYNKYYNGN